MNEPGSFSLPCPASTEDFKLVNIALSDPQRGMRDLYGKMTIPGLFCRPLAALVHDAAARTQAAHIAEGLPYLFFLLNTEDCQRFLFMVMDAQEIVTRDGSDLTGVTFSGQQLRNAFIPLASLMFQHMVRRGFSDQEIRARMISILSHESISEEVALRIVGLARDARAQVPASR
jgi:hypothetical protein